jgi:hypothetical protein
MAPTVALDTIWKNDSGDPKGVTLDAVTGGDGEEADGFRLGVRGATVAAPSISTHKTTSYFHLFITIQYQE